MPDHVHALGTLGPRLRIGQVCAKVKTLSKPHLSVFNCSWQRDFFERRLRPGDSIEDFVRYIFLNPYRDRFRDRKAEWPWWTRRGDLKFDFEAMIQAAGGVPEEWLDLPPPAGL